ncbi:nickel insertion protein, partial [Clostridioides difficile]
AYNREILERKFVKLDTKYGVVTVKLGYYKGELVKATPEYNECKTIAKNEDIPIKKVFADINFRIKEEFSENLLT